MECLPIPQKIYVYSGLQEFFNNNLIFYFFRLQLPFNIPAIKGFVISLLFYVVLYFLLLAPRLSCLPSVSQLPQCLADAGDGREHRGGEGGSTEGGASCTIK